jgi:hypothetical protein
MKESLYEVIMYSESCPSETSSLGLYSTRELAKKAIEEESVHYGEDTVFDIEHKLFWG